MFKFMHRLNTVIRNNDNNMLQPITQISHILRHLLMSFCCLLSATVGGVVALSVECRTCNQEAVGSILRWAHGVKILGKFLTPICLCHQEYKLVLA